MPELSVEITGNVKSLKNALREGDKEIKAFDSEADKFSKKFVKNNKRSERSSKELNRTIQEQLKITIGFEKELLKVQDQLAQSGKKAFSPATSGLLKQEAQLKKALKDQRISLKELNLEKRTSSKLEVDQVKGIRRTSTAMRTLDSITNGLATEFLFLTKATKQSNAAMNSAALSLGIGAAIIAVTVLWSKYSDKLSSVTKKTKDLNKINEGFASALGSTYTEFKILTDVLLDANSSYKDQQKAITVLNKDFEDFDTTLITNKKSYESAKKAVDDYSVSLIAQAKATAGLALISEKQAKILILEEEKLLKIRNSFGAKNEAQLERRRKRAIANAIKQAGGDERRAKKNIQQLERRFDAVKNLNKKEIDELKSSIERISNLSKIKDLVLSGSKSGASGLDTSALDASISRIKLKLAELSLAYSDSSLDFSDRFLILSQQFTKESELISANYAKQLALAKGNKNAQKVAFNEQQIALLALREKFNSLGLDLANNNIKQVLKSIETKYKQETSLEVKNLTEKYNELTKVTSEQVKTYNKEKKRLETQGYNESLLAQNAYLSKLLEDEKLSGDLRMLLEQQIQDNLAKLRGEGLNTTLSQLRTFTDELQSLLENSLISTFSNIGSAIGDALSNSKNIVQAIGGSILGAMGAFLSKMGDLLIQYGTLAILKGKLDVAIAAGGPIAIGAGLAAVAVGVAIKAIGGAFSNAASSGLGNSNSGGSVGSSSGGTGSNFGGSSFSGGFSGGISGGTVVFEIQGTKLVGVLSNTLRRNRALGGDLSLID